MIIFVSSGGGIAFRWKDNCEKACHRKIMRLAVSKFNRPGSRASETILWSHEHGQGMADSVDRHKGATA